MKRIKKSINALLFFVLASIALTNCGKDEIPDDPSAPEACFTFTDEGTYLSNLGSTDLPTITGNTLKNSINYGISTYATQIDVSNNTFENNALGETHDHAL
ncbi:MAG: hypothetical protein RLQ12_16770 [Cyclobacteriaceae bacterium]